ncbi:MAG: hypothetical protein HY329_19165 [Chloroflexi bacterium]|nr:hypothetical protein [Chloroflexota bacterium]
MNEELTLRRLRGFLFGLAAALLIGTTLELVLVGHAEDLLQLIPFALCGLGLLALLVAWLRPSHGSVLTLRIVMVALALWALLGSGLHPRGNLELARETQPNAMTAQLAAATLAGGNPLLAPGILTVVAALALAGTYSAAGEPVAISGTRTASGDGGAGSTAATQRTPAGSAAGRRGRDADD